MHTVFPDPVAAGDQQVRHGREVRHQVLARHVLAEDNGDLILVRSPGRPSRISRKKTRLEDVFGTSMPTVPFPGMGA